MKLSRSCSRGARRPAPSASACRRRRARRRTIGCATRRTSSPRSVSSAITESTRNGMSSLTISITEIDLSARRRRCGGRSRSGSSARRACASLRNAQASRGQRREFGRLVARRRSSGAARPNSSAAKPAGDVVARAVAARRRPLDDARGASCARCGSSTGHGGLAHRESRSSWMEFHFRRPSRATHHW